LSARQSHWGKIELGELNNSDLLHRNVNSAVMTLCRCSGRVVKALEAEAGIELSV